VLVSAWRETERDRERHRESSPATFSLLLCRERRMF
jgi:hypothetical protein